MSQVGFARDSKVRERARHHAVKASHAAVERKRELLGRLFADQRIERQNVVEIA
jgi:hypothetical protein